MEKNILNNILSGRRVLISHYLNSKLKIVVYLINNTIEKTIVFDEKNLLNKTNLVSSFQRDVIVSNNLASNPPLDYRLVYIEPSIFPTKIRNRNVLVTLTPRCYRFRIPRHYTRVYLTRVSGNTHVLHLAETMEKHRFRIVNDNIEIVDKPEGIYGKAYEVIRNAVIEYGELSIRDAVNMLVRELSVSRENARKILSKLVLDKYIRVEKGFISIY